MRRARVVLLMTLASLILAAPAAAAKPEMERVTFDESDLDEFLTDACEFDVFFELTGHITFRRWIDAEGNVSRELNNFAVHNRLSSASASIRLVDVGVDRVTYNEDGSITQVVIGNVQSIQVPGQGRVYSDVGQTTLLVTFPDPEGEPVFEVIRQVGQHSEVDQVELICEVLAP